jgi:hypothetical protein
MTELPGVIAGQVLVSLIIGYIVLSAPLATISTIFEGTSAST